MDNKKNNVSNYFRIFLICLCYFNVLFIGTEVDTLISFKINTVWFQRIIIFEFLVLFVLNFTHIVNKHKIDRITGFFILKLISAIFTFLLYQGDTRSFIIYGFLQFVFLLNIFLGALYWENFDINAINKIIKISLVILSLQILLTAIKTIVNYGLMSVKAYMILPIGDSNFIAIFLGPLLIYYYMTNEKKISDKIVIVLTGVSYLLLMSRSGLACFLLVLFLASNDKKNKKISYKLILPLFIIVLMFLFFDNSSFTTGLFSSYRSIFDTIKTHDLNKVTSGRVLIYGKYINAFFQKPIFGHGYEFVQNTMGSNAHNYVLSELYTTGLFGTIPYLCVLVLSMVLLKRNKEKNQFILGIYYGCLYSLLHGLFEPGIQGFIAGFSFWLLLGFGINFCYAEKDIISESAVQQTINCNDNSVEPG